ncbi:MAG TPA: hypothetical protein VIP05_33420 [Burkholderiaceae bacterium]
MNPVPEVEAPRRVPVEFLPFEPAREPRADGRARTGTVLPDGELGIGALLRFKSLMAAEGQPVQLGRMCHDRLYAYERIAAAHAGGREDLRRLALELFQIYHRRAAGLPAQ